MTCGFVAQSAGADDVSDQQQQVKDDLAEIERLEQKSSQLNEEYLGYVNEKAALEAEIAVGLQHIDARQAELTELESQLAQVAIQRFTGGSSGGFAMFGDTSNATDSLQRDQLVRTAVNAGAANTDDYERLLDDLADEQEDLQAKQERVTRLAEQAADTLERTEQAGREYQAELARDQALLGDLLIQEQQRQEAEAAAKHAAEVAKAKADEKAAAEQAAASQAAASQAAEQAARDQAAQQQSATEQAQAPQTTSSSGNGSTAATATVAPTTNAPDSDDDEPPSADADFGATGTTTPDAEDGTASGSDAGGNADEGSGDSANEAQDSGSSGDDAGSNLLQVAPPVSSRAQVAVAAARSQLGVPYQFARSSPGTAFDCSGLTSYAWAQAGVSIPHQSAQQYASTPHVAITDIQPGDLLYFYSPISHVSIYIGNGQQIHAPAPGKFVEIANVNYGKLVGASRPG